MQRKFGSLVIVVCGLAALPCNGSLVVAVSEPPAQSHYERPATKGGPYKERVVVFLHGIFGDAKSSWTNPSGVYWPRLLLTDDVFRDSDVYVASYSSPYFGNTMNIDERVASLNNRLVNDDIFSKHREVVFVCHSLGGLIVQRLLLTFKQYAAQVPFIYLFSTPETGAQIANLFSVFSSDPLLKEMFAGDENDYLQNLENEWKGAQFHIPRLCAYEKKKYKGKLVVDRLSATRNCDNVPIPVNEDHLGIVKPDGVTHESYVALRNAYLQYQIASKPAQIDKPKRTSKPKAIGPPAPSCHISAEIKSEIIARIFSRFFPLNTHPGEVSYPSFQELFYEWEATISRDHVTPQVIVEIDNLSANDQIVTDPLEATRSSRFPRSFSGFPDPARTADHFAQVFTFNTFGNGGTAVISIRRRLGPPLELVHAQHVINLADIRGTECTLDLPVYNPQAMEGQLNSEMMGLANWKYASPKPQILPIAPDPGDLKPDELESSAEVRCKTPACNEVIQGLPETRVGVR